MVMLPGVGAEDKRSGGLVAVEHHVLPPYCNCGDERHLRTRRRREHRSPRRRAAGQGHGGGRAGERAEVDLAAVALSCTCHRWAPRRWPTSVPPEIAPKVNKGTIREAFNVGEIDRDASIAAGQIQRAAGQLVGVAGAEVEIGVRPGYSVAVLRHIQRARSAGQPRGDGATGVDVQLPVP